MKQQDYNNGVANESCKHRGFFFFLRHFGPCITSKEIMNTSYHCLWTLELYHVFYCRYEKM